MSLTSTKPIPLSAVRIPAGLKYRVPASAATRAQPRAALDLASSHPWADKARAEDATDPGGGSEDMDAEQ
jgi:hypothetical protein